METVLFQTCLRPRGKSSHWAALPRARKTKPANEMYLKKKEKEKKPPKISMVFYWKSPPWSYFPAFIYLCGHMNASKIFVLLNSSNNSTANLFVSAVGCLHPKHIYSLKFRTYKWRSSSYHCFQRPVWRCGAHAVRDHGLNRLRPFSCVRYDIAAWCLMGLEKEVNMSSTLWIPLHKDVDLHRWVHQLQRWN